MKHRVSILHSMDADFELEKLPSVYVPSQTVYCMISLDQKNLWSANEAFLKMARTIYEAEKETGEWIRKYQNAMNGLNYWKEKALEKS